MIAPNPTPKTIIRIMSAILVVPTFVEKRTGNPILSLGLFRNKVFLVSVCALFLTSMGMFGAIIYIPVFSQGVIGGSATHAGLAYTYDAWAGNGIYRTAKVFNEVKPKLAAYSHIAKPYGNTEQEILKRTKANYSGPLIMGEDLMSFSITDSVSINNWQSK
jgi:hypothetical protein